MTNQLLKADLDLLGKFDTPTVCNVIELFDFRPRSSGYMDSRIRSCFPEMSPMVGYAATATHRSAAAPQEGDVYSSLDKQVATFAEVPTPPIVVFQDLDDPPVGATFGEIMCATYQAFGAVGLVTSGAARDLTQVRALGFPTFSNGTICSHGYSHIVALNIPVHVGGITVRPGDLLHGDGNGVTTIPLDIASVVAHACTEFAAAEEIVLGYLRSGAVTPRGLAEARAEMRHVITSLQQRIIRRK